jgi:hypothetical protein
VAVEAAEGSEVSRECELPDADDLARSAKALPEHPAVGSCAGGVSAAHGDGSSTSIPAGCSSSSGGFCAGSFPFSFFLSKSRRYFRTSSSDTWVFTGTPDASCTVKLHFCLESLHPSQAPVGLGMQGFCFFLHRSHYERKIQVDEKRIISAHLKRYCTRIPT